MMKCVFRFLVVSLLGGATMCQVDVGGGGGTAASVNLETTGETGSSGVSKRILEELFSAIEADFGNGSLETDNEDIPRSTGVLVNATPKGESQTGSKDSPSKINKTESGSSNSQSEWSVPKSDTKVSPSKDFTVESISSALKRRNLVADERSDVVVDFSPWSPSDWRPVARKSKSLVELRRGEPPVVATTATPPTTSNGRKTTPFQGSPKLSASGWIPVTQTKPPRQGRFRHFQPDFDYDDIITASPEKARLADNFELVVGAKMNSGASVVHQGEVEIVALPKSMRTRRAVGALMSDVDYDLLDGREDPPPTVFAPKFVHRAGMDPQKFITRLPVSVKYDNFNNPMTKWSSWSQTLPQANPTVVYVPFREYSSHRTDPAYTISFVDKTSPDTSKGTYGANLWRDGFINKLFTLPPVQVNPATTKRGMVKPPQVEIATPASKEMQLDVQPIMNAPQQPPVIPNRNRVPYSVRIHATTENARNAKPVAEGTAKTIDLETKHFVAEEETLSVENNQTNADGRSTEPFLSTENLTYLLVGVCCGLSLLCLLVIVVTMRCRRFGNGRKPLGNLHRHSELINGWEAVTYPKPQELAFENTLAGHSGNITLDPWFDTNPAGRRTASTDVSNVMAPNGVLFETLGIGPIKEIKRTTVIPAQSTAFVTDGHTAVMRELSSVSSSGSVNSRQGLCSSPNTAAPYRQRQMVGDDEEDDAPESLDIPVELFDQNSPKKVKRMAPQPPKLLPPPPSAAKRTPVVVEAVEKKKEDPEILWTSNDERLI